MADNSYLEDLKPETFVRLPDSEDIFLETRYSRVTYGRLSGIVQNIKKQIDGSGISNSQKNPLIVRASPSESLILFLASCHLLKIPIFPFNPDYSNKELAELFHHFPHSTLVNLAGENHSNSSSQLSSMELEIPSLTTAHKNSALNYFKERTAEPERILLYLHTSGTSGPAKIVPVKSRQLLFAAQSNARLLWPDTDEKWLLCLPLHHIGGLSIIGRTLLYGSAIYYTGKFDEKTVGDLLSNDATVKVASLVPTMLKKVLDTGLNAPHSNLAGILLGGGPLDASLVGRAAKYDIPLVSSYGMTETCAQIAAHKITDTKNLPDDGSITGHIFPPNEIQIRDEDNLSLNPLRPGSIHLRGPQVFDGYLNKDQVPEAQIFDEEGFFNTGDFGYIDKQGRLVIQSRRTDLIVTGGENVSPYEVEAALEELDEIEEAVVFGLADQVWGRKVAAAIVQREDTHELTISMIKQRLSGRLKSYQLPKALFHRSERLPRTSTGKLKRKELYDYYNTLENDS